MSDKPIITDIEFFVAKSAYEKEYSLREALEALIQYRNRNEEE